ncbi:WXG100 family type VII secretion target [Mariniluteicoccus flavus]
MSDQVSFEYSYLQQGVDDLNTAKREMATAKQTMQQEIKSILGETWTGPSYEAYQAVLREWDQSMEEMERIANGISTALGTISSNYSDNERRIHGQWA